MPMNRKAACERTLAATALHCCHRDDRAHLSSGSSRQRNESSESMLSFSWRTAYRWQYSAEKEGGAPIQCAFREWSPCRQACRRLRVSNARDPSWIRSEYQTAAMSVVRGRRVQLFRRIQDAEKSHGRGACEPTGTTLCRREPRLLPPPIGGRAFPRPSPVGYEWPRSKHDLQGPVRRRR